jgi:hypothetical protein
MFLVAHLNLVQLSIDDINQNLYVKLTTFAVVHSVKLEAYDHILLCFLNNPG